MDKQWYSIVDLLPVLI